MSDYRVLVIGGYGFFGSRLVRRLARQRDLHVIVAGRSCSAAQTLVDSLQANALSRLSAIELDAMGPALHQRLIDIGPALVIHTSGPFQGQDYCVSRACIAAGAHYIDLADGREFVSGIKALDAQAKAAKVFVTSGASSVPALSSAVADGLTAGMHRVEAIDIGINPGNRTERGLATVAGILSYCGKPLPGPLDQQAVGWLGSHRQRYPPPVGSRLLSPCEVPDRALLPARYPGTPTVTFGAGLELAFLHRGMNVLAWLAHIGVVRDWSAHAGWLKRAGDLFIGWGTDTGAMHVEVTGRDAGTQLVRRRWFLVAGQGDGPYVPVLAACALTRKLSGGTVPDTGAFACMGFLSLEDFSQEAQGLDIHMAEASG
jgi:hypothetical protein